MYLAPEGQELEIADAAQAFLGDSIALGRLNGAEPADLSADARKALAELGWFGLALPEAQGGSGLTAVEHTLFFREVGRLCGPLDILAQCLAITVLQDAALRDRLLQGADGVCLVIRDGSNHRIFGNPDARWGLLVEPEQAGLHDLAGLQASERPGLDRINTMRLCAELPIALETAYSPAPYMFAQLALAAMQVGIAETALELIVEYAKVRETFGRKIGAYQAVRHPCADMAVRLEAARAQLWFAAAAVKAGRADAPHHLVAAKHLANEAATRNADTNIQLHGGIGVTEEHHAHLLLKRSLVLGRLFGSKDELLGQLLHASLDD